MYLLVQLRLFWSPRNVADLNWTKQDEDIYLITTNYTPFVQSLLIVSYEYSPLQLLTSLVAMFFSSSTASPVVGNADNIPMAGTNVPAHTYPPAWHVADPRLSRQEHRRDAKCFSSGFFPCNIGLSSEQSKTPAQEIVEQYRAKQLIIEEQRLEEGKLFKEDQIYREEQQATRMRFELDMNKQKLSAQHCASSSISVPPHPMDEDIPPPVPPKDYPLVEKLVSMSALSALSPLGTHFDSLVPNCAPWVHRDTYETEETMNKLESGPKVRFSMSRMECLGVAVSVPWKSYASIFTD